MTFVVMQCQCWHHITQMALSMAQLHLQVNMIKMRGNMTFQSFDTLSMTSASYNSNTIVNNLTAFKMIETICKTVLSIVPFYFLGHDD